MTLHHNCAIAT